MRPRRILYGVVGEGMGHATRSQVVAAHLEAQGHHVKLVASGRAHAYLAARFADVVEIRGLTLHYRHGAMDRDVSLLKNVALAPSMLLANVEAYLSEVRDYRPDLVFSDFESWSWAFAKRFGLPIVSLDNQQIIHKCKHDRDVWEGAEADYRATRAFVKAKLPGCDHYVVTSFFAPKVREKWQGRVTIVPPILRREILDARPTRGDHVLVYQTSTSDDTLLDALATLTGERFVVYGLRRDEQRGHVVLKGFREAEFVADLASAKAVVTNAGLSLIHEAIYLGKPLFCVPVAHQFEQDMNARYVEKYGYGLTVPRMDAGALAAFLGELPKFEAALARHVQQGNEAAFAVVDGLVEALS